MTSPIFLIVNFVFVVGLVKLYSIFFSLNGLVSVGAMIYFWLSFFVFSHWNDHYRRLDSLSDRALEELESTWLLTTGFYRSSARPSIISRLRFGNDRHALLKGLHRALEIREEVLRRTKEKNASYHVGKIAKLDEDIKTNKDAIARLESEIGSV
jgi:hypothetical protein